MKKILATILFVLSFVLVNGQSYIGEKYENFFSKMISEQNKNDNYIITGPDKEIRDDGSYFLTIGWKNEKTQVFMATSYFFSSNNVCEQMYQFMPLLDKKLRKSVLKTIKKTYDLKFDRDGKYWFEYKKNMKIRHTVEESEMYGSKGISMFSEKL